MKDESNTEWIEVSQADIDATRHYALVIEWSSEDAAFVVSVPDIPDLHTHGATREEAAAMGNEAIALWLAGARETGVDAPRPRFSALRASAALADTAERIRQVRRRLNASQREFAALLNVSVGTIRSWEQGTRTPDGASQRLLDIAERQPDVLLEAASNREGRSVVAA